MELRSAAAVVLLAALLAGCAGLEPITEARSEVIEFESVDLPGRLWDPFMPDIESGEAVTVSGTLRIPVTDAPVPVVIIAHGCGGIGGAELSWVPVLEDLGVASFVVDSFRGRGIGNICTGQETINVLSPVIDVFRAADLLDANPYVDGSRMAVMGFSFGGRAAIWSGFTRFRNAYEGRAFSTHLAFYPSTCYIELADEDFGPAPLRIFHGAKDNWTPLDQCEAMIGRLVEGGADAQLFAYPDAGHSFDDPGLAWGLEHLSVSAVSPRNCTFVEVDGEVIDQDTGGVAGVGSTCVETGVNFGYVPAAREAASADLTEHLKAVLGP